MKEQTAANGRERRFETAIADAYRDASLAGADIREAADRIERLRRLTLEPDPIHRLIVRMTAVLAPTRPPLLPILAKLRNDWAELTTGELCRRLRVGGDDAADLWHLSVSGALEYGRFTLLGRLAEAAPTSLVAVLDPAALAKGAAEAAVANWREAVELFEQCANAEALSPKARAVALGMLALIAARLSGDQKKAELMIKRMESLVADFWFRPFVCGILAVDDGKNDEARILFEDAAKREPEISAPLVELARATEDDREARSYLAAAARKPRGEPTTVIEAEIERIGRASNFPTERERIGELLEITGWLATEPHERLGPLMAAVRAYQANGCKQEEMAVLDRAIALHPSSMDARSTRGHSRLDSDDRAGAVADHDVLARNQPNSSAEAWLRYRLREAEEDWEGILAAAQDCVVREPALLGDLRDRTEKLATDLYQKHDRPDLAFKFLKWARDMSDSGHEAKFRNLRGHVSFWIGDYAAALTDYSLAHAANPDELVYAENIGRAAESGFASITNREARLADALAAIGRANGMRDKPSAVGERLRRLVSFVERYGAAATSLTADAFRMRIYIAEDLVKVLTRDAQLTPEIQAEIVALRESIRTEHGLTLCAMNLSRWEEASPRQWSLAVGNQEIERGFTSAEVDAAVIFQDFAAAIRSNLSHFVGLDEAEEIARGRLHLERNLAAPERVRVAAVIRTAFALGLEPENAALLEAIAEPVPPPQDFPEPQPPALVLTVGANTVSADQLFTEVQLAFHGRTRVVCPLPAIERAVDLAPNRIRLTLGGQNLYENNQVAAGWAVDASAALAPFTSQLVLTEAVERQLDLLSHEEPRLVEAARALLSRAERQRACADFVRERLWLNLPIAIEAALLAKATEILV